MSIVLMTRVVTAFSFFLVNVALAEGPKPTGGAASSTPKVVAGPPAPGDGCLKPAVVQWEGFSYYTYQCPPAIAPSAAPLLPATGGIIAAPAPNLMSVYNESAQRLEKYKISPMPSVNIPKGNAFAEMEAFNAAGAAKAAEARAAADAVGIMIHLPSLPTAGASHES